jgi:hypothetical protein
LLKILFILVLLVYTNLTATFLDEANNAILDNNVEKAIKLYKLSAREGDDEANFQLGKIYYLKMFGKKDLDKAYVYFKKAAAYEHKKAKYNLAIVYSQKEFKKHSYKRAYELFLSLAKQGYPNAQYMVGIYLLYGLGVQKDYSLAKRWLEESYFKNNYEEASCAISFIYANGLGVIQNLGRARNLSQNFISKFPLCRKVFNEFKLYKNRYKEDKGFKFGYYK